MNDLTGKKAHAAQLVALDEQSDEQIAVAVGISKRTLENWKKEPLFQTRVKVLIDEFARELQRYHIARRDKRLAAMDRRWRALHQVIEERAQDGTMPANVPGVETGHIVRTFKGKDADVEEYVIDTGLLSELRALEKQAAQEAGQWTEKKEVNGTTTVNIVAEVEALLDRPISVHIVTNAPNES